MRIPLLVTSAVAGAAVVLFAGCSSASPSAGSNASSAQTGADGHSQVLLSAQQSTAAGTAQVDIAAQLNLPVLGSQTAKGNGVVDFDAQKAQAHLDAGGLALDGVVDGNTVYVGSPILGADTWYRVDTADHNAGGLSDIWAQVVDPAQLFNQLQDAASSMVAMGSEQVNGVQTTHYHGELDLQKAARAGATSASATVPIDVWVDGQGLVARVQVALASSSDQGSTGSGTVTVDFHDYGKPVTVNVPPANQVEDLSDALGGVGSFLKGG